jgi:hypothetical protein
MSWRALCIRRYKAVAQKALIAGTRALLYGSVLAAAGFCNSKPVLKLLGCKRLKL